MRKAYPLCFLLVALSFTTVLTAQTVNSFFRHIPPDAEQVYHINLAVLGSKVSWDEISGLVPAPKSESDQEFMKYVKDPSLSGIDFHQGLIITSSHLDKNTDSPACLTILAHLVDSGKLLSLIRDKEKKLHSFKLPGKGSVAGEDRMAFAWNDKMVVFTIVIIPKHPEAGKVGAGASSAYYTLAAAKKSMAALEGFNNSIYTTDATFMNGFSDDADFHIWSPQGSILKQLAEMSKKKNPLHFKVPASTSQLHSLTSFRFDAGKIVTRTTTIVPPDSAYLYKIYNSRPLNTDLITHLPGKAILGMVNMHFDPSLISGMLDKYHIRQMIDSMLSSKGVTVDDILKTFKGDFLIAATQPTQIPDTGKVEPNIYFAATIADLGTLMKVGSKLGLNPDSKEGLGKKMGFTLKDNILVVGGKGQTEAFFSTNNSSNLNLINDRVRNSTFSGVVDIKAIIAFIKASQRGDIESSSSRKSQQMFHFLGALDHITFTSGSYQNGVIESYFEISMTDTSENSLRSLFKLIHG